MDSKQKMSQKRKKELEAFEIANMQAEKRQKHEKTRIEVERNYGKSYNIFIFRKDLQKMTENQIAKLKTDVAVYQIQKNIPINNTKAVYSKTERSYKIRVHTQEEREFITQMINELMSTLTTFCFMDEPDMDKIIIKVPTDFPEILINPDNMNSLLDQTVGKVTAKKEICQVNN